MMVELVRTFTFQAAHYLPKVSEDHKCRHMHGHAYRVEVSLRGPVNPETGWLVDFGEIAIVLDPIRKELDHTILNEIPGLENPTAEILSAWIWQRVTAGIPYLHRVSVFESENSGCHYLGD
ncbi:MAG: 6-carboxytetrahydropterin synthase QueD [Candidatus Eisenbacteria bacterium]|uniref:6-carboxy-5,6,7,8-tetrahydropterin synthase n=1 Tax=Eiseniibacteriota bacterium TaxID=2212470 RepID=A0A948W6P0_UNCEI|nr:6-carboxytetrahydropterin synthase QueD [Candidatus Eisenbacteria bacterium]MBU1947456.1 6-carboxytetrahydropterin synthase QueD [Candidatus Eisenbacteria bacterium]MBU2690851.1 6-carboxytetrahydropterin synthase QueD [Candidatus Eisenbacteria bacterium]